MADISHLLEPTFYHFLDRNLENINFFVVGAGGTGGYLIPNLTRQVSLRNENKSGLKHTITVIDGDMVERKNLTRQNFVESDIGKNKAAVMAARYGRAFTQEVSYVEEFLSTPESLTEMVRSNLNKKVRNLSQQIVIIDCTDNNKTRLLIKEAADALSRKNNVVFLSSGNEEKAGQVVCSFKMAQPDESRFFLEKTGILREDVRASTPDFFEVFPNTEIDKLPEEVSCAENAISAPQNIATNMTAANILFSYANKLLANEGISELAVFFDSSIISQRVYRAKLSDYKELLSLVKNNSSLTRYLPRNSFELDKSIQEKAMTWSEALEEAEKKKVIELAEAQKQLDALALVK